MRQALTSTRLVTTHPMIGVYASSTELSIVEEFFELFKTPWERALPGRRYSVVLSGSGCVDDLDAELFIVYSSHEEKVDRATGNSVERITDQTVVDWADLLVPVYCGTALFHPGDDTSIVRFRQRAVGYRRRIGSRTFWRIGYDLFQEVLHLLTKGQPVSNSVIPTLELHIDLLRQLLLQSGISFVEIPPVPAGYDFTCCLTHDVDFFGIRRHKLDRTLAGFVFRASLGSVADFARGRRPLADVGRNMVALASLPLIFLGLIGDFWQPFEDYAKVEDGRRSTFFLVPFSGRPGESPDGTIDRARAVAYQISDVREHAWKAAARGSELAVHGIDAWRDAEAGRAEMSELTSVTGRRTAGVRMHWLYFAEDSFRELEAAGFDYDTTCGYNEAVGYKAGTSQVFRPLGVRQLMELPLSIMDSALFYSKRMGLTRQEAARRCRQIVTNAKRYGGTLVVNWHERSLAPERLWGRFYQDLLEEIDGGGRPWFVTAGEAVDWFRWRRSIRFSSSLRSQRITIAASESRPADRPARVRLQRPSAGGAVRIEEHCFDGREEMALDV